MMRNTKISELMTTELICLNPNDTLERVSELFRKHKFHHIPVIDPERKVLGMISKGDFLAVSNAFPLFNEEKRKEANERIFQSLLVEDVMTRQIATLHPDDTLEFAAGYFRENLFHALPVLNKEDKLVGLLSTYDVLIHFFKLHSPNA